MKKTLREIVFEGLGEASMCWKETPKGVFDDEAAKVVGEKLITDITAHFAPKPIQVKNLSINSWCPLCKKPESWNGKTSIGSADEEGFQDAPQTCTCKLNLSTACIAPSTLF
jgi:hypothetical protein